MTIDYIQVIFLGRERNEEGKLQAEEVPLLSLMNASEVTCKIIERKTNKHKDPTGEELAVSSWDPQHGLVDSGERIDGWVENTDTTFVLQVPGITEPVEIDGKYVNV